MYYDEHLPPHFHARYAEWQASIAIDDGEILGGEFPRKAMNLVQEWVLLHREQLLVNWNRATQNQTLNPIDPLR